MMHLNLINNLGAAAEDESVFYLQTTTNKKPMI